jgi:hypothetical protein
LKTIRALVLPLLAISTFSALAATPDFEVGQVWEYKTRVGEEESRVLINKVEEDPKLGRIFHISISKIHLRNSAVTIADELPHLPVSLETLNSSCTMLVGLSEPNPMYLKGYLIWKQAFDAGNAGIYTIPIAEILNVAEGTLQKSETRQRDQI